MSIKRLAAIAVLLSFSAGAASAATATGRITHLSADQMVLDNGDQYGVAATVKLPPVGVGDLVRINWENRAGKPTVTSVTKAPPAVAVYH